MDKHNLKAIVVHAQRDTDLAYILNIAKHQATKIFHNPGRLKIVDCLWSQRCHGHVVLVENVVPMPYAAYTIEARVRELFRQYGEEKREAAR